MEALKSAEALQVHWQEAHDVEGGASAAGNTFYSGASANSPLIKLACVTITTVVLNYSLKCILNSWIIAKEGNIMTADCYCKA